MKLARIHTPEGPVWAAETTNGLKEVVWHEGNPRLTDRPAPAGRFLAPVDPVQIIGIGLNYRHHAAETGAKIPEFPVVFFKGLNSLAGPDDAVVLPRKLASQKVDFECELAFVMKHDAKNVCPEQALDYILGFTIANDVSARDWQKDWGGSQWCRGKSFDTFCPAGPFLVTVDEMPNFGNLKMSTRLNGRTMQDWSTNDLIFDIPTLVEFLSGSTTLLAGTMVLTGTPHGVGMARNPPVWLKPGDLLEMEIEGIGVLRNPVVEEHV